MYQVYKLEGNASITLFLLSLGPKTKVKCYNEYFINGHMFHIEEYEQGRKTYNNEVCVKRSTFNEFKVDYYEKLKEVIELQYHNEQNKIFLFKCYWYDTIERGIRVDPHHGLAKINSKAKLCNVDNVFVFAKQCQQIYYTHTLFFRKDHSRVDWLSILKTKPMSRVKVVQEENDESNMRDDVFQVSELVDPYRVPLSIDLEENSNFHVTENIFVDVNGVECCSELQRTNTSRWR
jgi:hypothetical protein